MASAMRGLDNSHQRISNKQTKEENNEQENSKQEDSGSNIDHTNDGSRADGTVYWLDHIARSDFVQIGR